jgi:hypothetical protein
MALTRATRRVACQGTKTRTMGDAPVSTAGAWLATSRRVPGSAPMATTQATRRVARVSALPPSQRQRQEPAAATAAANSVGDQRPSGTPRGTSARGDFGLAVEFGERSARSENAPANWSHPEHHPRSRALTLPLFLTLWLSTAAVAVPDADPVSCPRHCALSPPLITATRHSNLVASSTALEAAGCRPDPRTPDPGPRTPHP